MEMNTTTRPEEVTEMTKKMNNPTGENLAVYTGRKGYTNVNIVKTVATFGADTQVDVDTCDGRPDYQIDEVTRNAVRMTVNSSYWADGGPEVRVMTYTAMTAKDALRLARDLIAQASHLIPDEG